MAKEKRGSFPLIPSLLDGEKKFQKSCTKNFRCTIYSITLARNHMYRTNCWQRPATPLMYDAIYRMMKGKNIKKVT
ncbi:hypothetical protein A7K69_16290 [Parageobacillus thermoglucosidasius]|uniref:Uncharacterized protein n=1 Tax=Parageobacillus thermoglucosidasius TaxID=1426 RepID=A0A1B7KVP4_PARTM|nr:hypothetical protein A7K69_16290 [Parageobacillus thermoglucosidasius]